MIHLEILELNFWGLNKYTKRNIDIRGNEDISLGGRDSSVDFNALDINEDYYLNMDNSEKNVNNIEMNTASYKSEVKSLNN